MANDFGEAVGTIAGMVLAGFILLWIAQNTDTTTPVDLEAWGVLLILVAVGAGILMVLALLNSLVN